MKIRLDYAVRVALPDGAGTRRGPRQRQAGADYRDGAAEQHRLHLLRSGQQGPEERRAADPAGAGEGDGERSRNRPIASVNILDHDGRRTGRTLPVTDGRFTLDGAKDKAIYYEVVFRY